MCLERLQSIGAIITVFEHLEVLKCQVVLIKRTLLEHMTLFRCLLHAFWTPLFWTERMFNVFWCVLSFSVTVLILNVSVLNVWMLTLEIRTLTFVLKFVVHAYAGNRKRALRSSWWFMSMLVRKMFKFEIYGYAGNGKTTLCSCL